MYLYTTTYSTVVYWMIICIHCECEVSYRQVRYGMAIMLAFSAPKRHVTTFMNRE